MYRSKKRYLRVLAQVPKLAVLEIPIDLHGFM